MKFYVYLIYEEYTSNAYVGELKLTLMKETFIFGTYKNLKDAYIALTKEMNGVNEHFSYEYVKNEFKHSYYDKSKLVAMALKFNKENNKIEEKKSYYIRRCEIR